MKLFKLTVLATLCFALIAGLSSCEKEAEKKKVYFYTKTEIPMNGSQIAPSPSPSAGTGKLSVDYDKRTKVLNYTITWSGLSDSVIAIRLNGPAPIGYSSLKAPFTVGSGDSTSFNTTPYIVIQQFTGSSSRALYPASGSYTGSLNVDDIQAKELDLLNHYYYITLHTKTTLPIPGAARFLYRWFGEIRAQIVFQ